MFDAVYSVSACTREVYGPPQMVFDWCNDFRTYIAIDDWRVVVGETREMMTVKDYLARKTA